MPATVLRGGNTLTNRTDATMVLHPRACVLAAHSQLFIQHLSCARHCHRRWGQAVNKTDKQGPGPPGADSQVVGKDPPRGFVLLRLLLFERWRELLPALGSFQV